MNSSTLFYHYTTGTSLKGILETDELFCTDFRFLNDPSEIDYYHKAVLEYLNSNDCYREVYEKFYDEVFLTGVVAPKTQYIACFCQDSNSLSMWNNYSQGNGYCIGLDINSIRSQNYDPMRCDVKLIEVLYDLDEQNMLMSNMFEMYMEKLEKWRDFDHAQKNLSSKSEEFVGLENNKNLIKIGFMEQYHSLSLLFKHPSYKDEKEVRLVLSYNDMISEPDLKFRLSRQGVLVPYVSIRLDLIETMGSINSHPLSNELHLMGLRSYLPSIGLQSKIEFCKKSDIPFRQV